MDTLTISKELLATGLKQEQAEAIARIIGLKDNNVATKDFFKVEIAVLFNKLVLSMIAIAGISLTLVKLFF